WIDCTLAQPRMLFQSPLETAFRQEEAMDKLVLVGFLALLSSGAHSQLRRAIRSAFWQTADPAAKMRRSGRRTASTGWCPPPVKWRSVGRATTNVIGTAGLWLHSSSTARRFRMQRVVTHYFKNSSVHTRCHFGASSSHLTGSTMTCRY